MAHTWLAHPQDAAAVAQLLSEFRDYYGRDWPPMDSIRHSVEQLIGDPQTEYLLGAVDTASEPAGVCQLRYRHSVWTASDDCWLEDLFVRSGARGTGLGAALLQSSIERAQSRGCGRIELDTSEDNTAALGLYHRFGFSERSKTSAPARDLFLGLRLVVVPEYEPGIARP